MNNHTPRRLLAAVVIIPVILALGCTSGPTTAPVSATNSSYPVVVHSANGAITVAHRPTAIVSLSATATEMLYAIGAGAQVKAVDKNSDYPAGAPMTSLDGNGPNVEAIVNYKPDLVVVSDDPAGFQKQLTALGIPVLEDPAATTLAQAYQQYLQLGQATGHAAGAQTEVAHVKAQIAKVVASTPKPSTTETYYYELDQTYFSATSSTFIGNVFSLLGLKNIADSAAGAASSGGYPQLNAEYILKANPTYIFLADTLCCSQSAATVTARPGWSTLSAVANHRIVPLNDDIASRWGPRVVTLLQSVATTVEAQRVAPAS
ncbi:MAG TPA: ABC transporter substrate-binding protein [Acidimicrobiales bacterium]|jgi:iron complex transport system substrate-binding protein|nr:ABC transporter substrate-binding protein [Acidimicrobiales bacterium]